MNPKKCSVNVITLSFLDNYDTNIRWQKNDSCIFRHFAPGKFSSRYCTILSIEALLEILAIKRGRGKQR